MKQQKFPYLVPKRLPARESRMHKEDLQDDRLATRRLSDKASLLRPLQDEHLLEVYREAKKMNLSSEFIELLEEAISMRQLEQQRRQA